MFASQADMVARFGEDEVIALSDRADVGEIGVDALAAALQFASDEITPYLTARYQLPFESTPSVITGFACDIARYRLSGAGVLETDLVAQRYREAIKFLDKIAAGKICLGVNALNQVIAESGGVKHVAGTPVFNASALADY